VPTRGALFRPQWRTGPVMRKVSSRSTATAIRSGTASTRKAMATGPSKLTISTKRSQSYRAPVRNLYRHLRPQCSQELASLTCETPEGNLLELIQSRTSTDGQTRTTASASAE
jgi:hypothetical protein